MRHPSLSAESLYAKGEHLLRSGRVAVVMAAGGISSRMRGSTFRGKIPVGPVSGRTLFGLQGARVLALRNIYNADLNWIVVTSAQSHKETLDTFRDEGLPGQAEFVQQDSLPAMYMSSNPYKEREEAVLVPTGHGGIITALIRDGLVDRLMSQRVTDVFLFQFPNVLEKVCDPIMLGFHEISQHDVTLKGFRSLRQDEKVGRIIHADRTIVREYHYPIPNPTRYLANMGTYLIKLEFIQRCKTSGLALPWHTVPLTLPGLPPLVREEQFIFDLLAFTRKAGVLTVSRRHEYATIKEPEGENSPRAARLSLLRTYRDWLRLAGARPAIPRARVEISPSFALDALTVQKKIIPGTVYPDGSLFQ